MKNKIIEWLNKTGYPLELQAESILTETGFNVFNSHYYIDPEKTIPREIDLLAEFTASKDGVSISYNCLIECKKSDKPFIILRNRKNKNINFNIGSNYFVKDIMARALIARKELNIRLPRPSTSGFKLIQAHTNSDETIHKASFGLLKSFEHWLKSDSELLNFYIEDNVHTLAIPILVIQGNLFETYLDETNNLQINEIKSAVWQLSTGTDRDLFSIIVVNVDALEELAKYVKEYALKSIYYFSLQPKLHINNLKE